MLSQNHYFLTRSIEALGTAKSTHIPCPDGGRIRRVQVVADGAIADAAETITVFTVPEAGAAGEVAVTDSDLVLPLAGAAVGQSASFDIHPFDGTDEVAAGGAIVLKNDGGSTAAFAACYVVTLVR